MNGIIALLTDFGLSDNYVGVMRAVMLSIFPSAELIDLTHAVQPQQIRHGAVILQDSYAYFPRGTVFLSVVDPGVGSARKPVAVAAGDYYFVAPDNGLLSYTLDDLEIQAVVTLDNPDYQLPGVSYTFHGRDIFAPAAAHLAAGIPLKALGTSIQGIRRLPPPRLEIGHDTITGEVLYADHFGNLITSIGRLRWTTENELELQPRAGATTTPVRFDARAATVGIGDHALSSIHHAYSEVDPNVTLALVGSSGRLEIAVNGGSAAAQFATCINQSITLKIGR